jgi:talin
LVPSRSLPENNITEKDVLILKKKFFASDQKLDKSDPVQVHLLYIQCKENVAKVRTPVEFLEIILSSPCSIALKYSKLM